MKHIYLDVSGSMPDVNHPIIQRILLENQPAVLFDFDHRIGPHGSLGDFKGGTLIGEVASHARQNNAYEVVVITDGYFAGPTGPLYGEWTWHIMPNGVKPNVEGSIIMEKEA